MSTQIRIVIADDHPLFRRGLRTVLESQQGFTIVAEVGDGPSALAAIREYKPDVAVLDIDMPPPDGLEVAEIVRSEMMPVELVILSMHDEEETFNAVLDIGVNCFLLKDSAVNEIVECIRAAAAGRNYFSPRLSGFLLGRRNRSNALQQEIPSLRDLTQTERRVLSMVAQGKTSPEIARMLAISVRTAESHRAHIGAKLGLSGHHALLRFALEHRSEL